VVRGSHAIGVDVGGTKILAGVVTRDGEVLRRHERPTPNESQDALLSELEAAVRELQDDEIAAVGFGLPSTIDQRTGRAVASVNIPLAEVDFRDRMSSRLALPVGIDNDANAAGIAEWQVGAGRGTTDMIILTVGTGLGGGVIANGKPFRGGTGAGVELGHMVLVHDGRPCQGTCTGRGHLEPYVTGVAATRAARDAFGPAADAHRLVRLANEGDQTAIGILAEIGRHLGSAMGALVNIFDPELIVVGGGFGVAAGEFLLGPAREVLRREALPPGRDSVRVVQAELGTAAGLIGAAFVAFEALDAAT
jgi:glucokinase